MNDRAIGIIVFIILTMLMSAFGPAMVKDLVRLNNISAKAMNKHG